MKNLKLIKKIVKRKISIDKSIIIKILITTSFGIFLTSCTDEEKNTLLNSFYNKNISSFKENDTLIKVNNSYGKIEKDITLSVNGDNSIASHIKSDSNYQGTLENYGNIFIKGDKSIGMVVEGKNSKGINNGNIFTSSLIKIEGSGAGMLLKGNSIGKNNGLIKIVGTDGVGVLVESGTFINEIDGIIDVAGNGKIEKINGNYKVLSGAIGILSYDGNVYNSGNIVAQGDGDYIYEDENLIIANSASGILANNALKVENYGDISVKGQGYSLYSGSNGLFASGKIISNPNNTTNYEKVEVLNSGNIDIIGDFSKGISIFNGNLVNSGKISTLGTSSIGINVANNLDNLKMENEGDIKVVGNGKVNDNYEAFSGAIGILSSGGDIYNSGNIVAQGDGDYIYDDKNPITANSASGILANNILKLENYGDISVKGQGYSLYSGSNGLFASGKTISNPDNTINYEKVEVLNSGNIDIIGDFSKGINIENGNLVNTGKISTLGTSSIGINVVNYLDNLKMENEGDIKVVGNGKIEKINGNYKRADGTIGILFQNGNIYNSGNIVAQGDGDYVYDDKNPITANSASGILANNALKVENSGDISVKGQGYSLESGSNGLFASGKIISNPDNTTNFEKMKVLNSGNIDMIGDFSKGISIFNGNLVNSGKISTLGTSSIGINVVNYLDNLKMENEGDIKVVGNGKVNDNYEAFSGAIGILSSGGDIYNSGNIVAQGDGDYIYDDKNPITANSASGILANNVLKVENYGDISVKGQGYSLYSRSNGLFASGKIISNPDNTTNYEKVEVLNSGNIDMIGDFSKGINIENGNLINSGKISTLGVSSIGINVLNNLDNLKMENEGDIKIVGNGKVNDNYEAFSGAIGILSSGGDIYNSGNIVAQGDGDYIYDDKNPITANSASGILANNILKLENYGDIRVKGQGYSLYSGSNGLFASGKTISNPDNTTNYEKVEVLNSGNIDMIGDFSKGINIFNGNLINSGKISTLGVSSIGINVLNDLDNLKIENEGDIKVVGNGKVNDNYEAFSGAIGILSYGGDIYNSGNIVAQGDGDYIYPIKTNSASGILAKNALKLENYGDISIKGQGYSLEYGSDGLFASGKTISNPDNTISYKKVEVLNSGNIDMIGDFSKGINIENGNLINTGKISTLGDSSIGINIKNDLDNLKMENEGDIEVSGNQGIGINLEKGDLYNSGNILVQGDNAIGIQASSSSKVLNFGVITVEGSNSIGMRAEGNSTVINKESGIINVSKNSLTGMYAGNFSKAINYGTINIATGNENSNIIDDDTKIAKSGMFADGGRIENYGNININSAFEYTSSNDGVYFIGTNENGDYGKITAKNALLNGNVKVDSKIAISNFKNECTLQNIVDSEKITLGEKFTFTSNSLLYDAVAIKDRWGNLDAVLTRNESILADFSKKNFIETANIFGKYQNQEEFNNLSLDAKEVIKSIDTESEESINESLKDITPTIYSNLGRQIFETSESFKNQGVSIIKNLDNRHFNFAIIGEFQDIDNRNDINGYTSKLTGFIGAINFGNNIFGTMGYGHNKIDYKENKNGVIESVHLGLNKFLEYEDINLRLGVTGELNFHENTREMLTMRRTAKSDFESYSLRFSGEVSKIYGDIKYFKPFISLDIAHMNYDSFNEKDANTVNAYIESESYRSLLPKAGLEIGNTYGPISLFAGANYSYELGKMDKNQKYSFLGFSGNGYLPNDSLENGVTNITGGGKYINSSFTLSAEIGKSFGRRNNSFGKVSIMYLF